MITYATENRTSVRIVLSDNQADEYKKVAERTMRCISAPIAVLLCDRLRDGGWRNSPDWATVANDVWMTIRSALDTNMAIANIFVTALLNAITKCDPTLRALAGGGKTTRELVAHVNRRRHG